ncbi:MAG: mycothiol system anti-sigma-R factor [Mycobacteriales bacterium]
MSCGNPHETDCREVLAEVYFYLDEEMPDERRSRIRDHLDECVHCLRRYGLEQEVKALVARCCSDPAPEGLRDRVLSRLLAVRIEIAQVEYRAD